MDDVDEGDIPAADLAAGLRGEQMRADVSSGSPQHVVDGEARCTYRRRLAQLDGPASGCAEPGGDEAAVGCLVVERD